ALNNESYTSTIDDDERFFLSAFDNGLIGFIYHALQKDHISEKLYQHMTKVYYAYIASDIKHIEMIAKLKALLNTHHIDHIFLKGSHLKFIYPETYMRAMGDIDILIKDSEMNRVYEIFNDDNIPLKAKSIAHDLYLTDDDITIEIHPALYKKTDLEYQHHIFDPWSHADTYEQFTYILDPTYELVYLLYHLSKHIKTSGVGLRSLLDIGLFMKEKEKNIDTAKLNQLLNQVHLKTFFDVVITLNQHYFGLMKDFENHGNSLGEKRLDNLISFFTSSGIHGKGHTFNPFESRMATHQNQKKSRLSFYLGLFFPGYETMKGIYSSLNKWPILLPFYWLHRLFKKLFSSFKYSLRQTKRSLVKKKTIDEIKSIMQDLGL
ncbi:MAG: nucleotidyltransferase family protein, partial [Acholeplasmataceae bacterium]